MLELDEGRKGEDMGRENRDFVSTLAGAGGGDIERIGTGHWKFGSSKGGKRSILR